MKTLNNFFEKAHLFKVWLVIYPILIIFISILFYGLEYLSGERIITDNLIYLKFGALMGMIFSWMFVLMISMSRKSTPADNAPIESFHANLKRETLYSYNITSLKDYIYLVEDWIKFYNNNRVRLS